MINTIHCQHTIISVVDGHSDTGRPIFHLGPGFIHTLITSNAQAQGEILILATDMSVCYSHRYCPYCDFIFTEGDVVGVKFKIFGINCGSYRERHTLTHTHTHTLTRTHSHAHTHTHTLTHTHTHTPLP